MKKKKKITPSEAIVFSVKTTGLLLGSKYASDVIALYVFYYYCVKKKKNRLIWATTGYVARGLGISKKRVIRAKKILVEIGLIKNFKTRTEEGKICRWMIYVKYAWSMKTIENLLRSNDNSDDYSTPSKIDRVDFGEINISDLKKINKSDEKRTGISSTKFVFSEEMKKIYRKYKTNIFKRKTLMQVIDIAKRADWSAQELLDRMLISDDEGILILYSYFQIRETDIDSIDQLIDEIMENKEAAQRFTNWGLDYFVEVAEKYVKKYELNDWKIADILYKRL